MTEQNQHKAPYEPQSRQGTLIESLRQQPNFLMQQYNQKLKKENQDKGIKKAGGIYIPPHKLRALQQEMMEADPASEAHQRMMWELLRKSINGIVNKVNIANIQNVVIELFNENIMRGRGLLARALIKAQMASPNFTHVYAALIAVINTKVPEIGLLVAKRVLIQFRRSFQRNNKIVCVATTRMIAHLVNQRVLGQYIALQILLILLTSPTQDSVQIACDFMIEVGQVLSQITPAGANAIFQRFKSLLHQAQIEQKAQYSIQNLFAIRKTGFKEHAGVIPDLDLVEPEDQITHQLDLQEQLKGQQNLNMFKLDPKYEQTEAQWDAIKQQILGQQNIIRLKQPDAYQQQYDQAPAQEGIQDLTQQDLVNLRKTIYLAIQSTVNFQQCAHKIIKMNIAKGYQHELVDMILQCSMMQRIYQTFFGLLAERFCIYDNKFKELFERAFLSHYNNIFNQQANKIRNLAHLFGHLFHRKAIDWSILQPIRLTPDSTTAAARMFLKILLKDMAQNLGIQNLAKEFQKEQMKEYYQGLFPIQNMNDLRFAINYYTTIGLGQLTEQMREVLSLHEQIINERRRKQEEAQAQMLIQEQEEMMRLAMEQQKIKQEEQKKIKAEKKVREEKQDRRGRDDDRRERQRVDKDKRDERRQRDYRRDDRKEKTKNRQDNSSQRSQERDKRRQRSRSKSNHSSQDQRQKRKDKQRERERERETERRQKEKQRQRERERQRQKELQKEKQREREKEKEKQRQRQRQKQKLRQLQREKQKQKQKEEKQKQKQRQLQKTKEAQIQKRQKQIRQKNKERNRSRSRENHNRKRNDRRRRRSSSSVNNSSSQRQNRRKKNQTQKKNSSKKVVERKRQSSSDSSSSGLSSSSSSSSSKQKVQKINTRQAKVKKSSSGSVSSQSESSGEVSSSSNVKVKRVQSSSS